MAPLFPTLFLNWIEFNEIDNNIIIADDTPADTEVIPESVPRVEEASSNMSAVIGN